MLFGHTIDEVRKAIAAAVVSVAALVGFFVAVDPSTVETIVAVVGALLNVVAVYQTTNAGPTGVSAGRID